VDIGNILALGVEKSLNYIGFCLVHSPNQLKITDFGLAKLLASDEYYLATGGKVPYI
jgi:hypothetical protein